MRSTILATVGLLLVIGPVLAQGSEPQGDEFQVNTYTLSEQYSADVALDAAGEFVVVWQSEGSGGSDYDDTSIHIRRYEANGVPQDVQRQVNSYTTGSQNRPVVARAPQGTFLLVWESDGSFGGDSSSGSIQGRLVDGDGTPVTDQFQVNTYTTSSQNFPAAASDAQGNFIVVWQSYGSSGTDTSGNSIQGQRYDVSGAPVGGQFEVNSYTTGWQTNPDVSVGPQGEFVVVWESSGTYGTDLDVSIEGQRFDASGAKVGSQFQVNTYTTSTQYVPAVAIDGAGNFVVVWQSYGSTGTDTDFHSIQGQRYDAGGATVGGEFQVNTYTTNPQFSPTVTSDPQGSFVVTWTSYGSYGTDSIGSSVQGQRYDASGAKVGSQFQVNTYTTSVQRNPAIASDPQGSFVVVWESAGSFGTDTDGYSIQGQRFGDSALFVDGFESGDTSAWSSSVP